MSKVSVNGINLHYEEEGQGPPLLLISGYTTDLSAWDSIRHDLKEHFHLILVDNRGAGRSDSPDSPYDIETMAEDIKALMVFLPIQNCYILAHSMGTAIAQTLAIKYPKLIKKMVLANPLIHFQPVSAAAFHFFLKMRQEGLSLVTMTEGVIPWLFSNHFIKNREEIAKVLQSVETYPYPQSLTGQQRQFDALLQFNSESWFRKITTHTLVIEGEEDIICPADAKRMSREIPKSSHLLFPGQAHMEHIEKAGEFAGAVIKFFKNDN